MKKTKDNLALFDEHLVGKGLSINTRKSYLSHVKIFLNSHGLNRNSLLSYKEQLVEAYKPKTVNAKILALNAYLKFLKKDKWCLKMIKVQQKMFLENVISHSDYKYLKKIVHQKEPRLWYFVISYLGATGARVSEITKFKVDHIQTGYFEIYSKGGKIRRLYIPKRLQEETWQWLTEINHLSGYLFVGKAGLPITPRFLSSKLKSFAKKYGIDPKVVYPHSFRHMFAKKFLESFNDIALLADLLGHENIETTRIYLRRTSSEQHEIINRVVTW